MSPRSGVLLTLAVAVAAGCGSDPGTFSYIRVAVSVDATINHDELRSVNICEVKVVGTGGAHDDRLELPNCTLFSTPRDLGTFEYSTLSVQGELRFALSMRNLQRETVAMGETELITIVAGQTMEGAIVASSPIGLTGPAGGF